MSHYSKNPHYAPDDFSEDVARLERCEHEAGRWFNDATVVQAAVFNRTMADIAPYRGSPYWDRRREQALAAFTETTKGAALIYKMALKDLMLTGKISEATSYAYDDLVVDQMVAVVRDDRDAAYADFRRSARMEGVFA